MKKLLVSAAIALLFSTNLAAQNDTKMELKGEGKASIRESGGMEGARAAAREAAERDAIVEALKMNLSLDMTRPKNIEAVNSIRKQLSDIMKTTFKSEGDFVSAKSNASVDAAQIFELAKRLGISASSAMAGTKVLFLIDEFFGVGTRLDPNKPLTSEISYSHDKGSSFDRSVKASGSESSSSAVSASARESASSSAQRSSSLAASRDTRVAASDQSASSSREQQAIASRDRESMSASDQRAFAARDQQSVAGRERVGVAASDGRGASVAGARDTQVAGSRNTQVAGASDTRVASASDRQLAASSSSASASASDSRFAASDKQAIAASSSGRQASASSSQMAYANQSQDASSFSVQKNDKGEQRDTVSFTKKETFPGLNNAQPEEGNNARIAAKLAQVVQKFGVVSVAERDLRVDLGGKKLLIKDIENRKLYDYFSEKASKGSFASKYVVFGVATTHIEGKTPTGNVACSGSLVLTSMNVDTGEQPMVGTINKRTEGSVDSECRDFLADALATELAKTTGRVATEELQRIARVGQSYKVTLFSRLEIPAQLEDDVGAILADLASDPDELRDENSGDVKNGAMKAWMISAKGRFPSTLRSKVTALIPQYPQAKGLTFENQGTRIYMCLEGKCPEKQDR